MTSHTGRPGPRTASSAAAGGVPGAGRSVVSNRSGRAAVHLAQDGGLAEGPPQHVCPPQAGPRAGERAAHVHQDGGAIGADGGEADVHTGACPHVRRDLREPGPLQCGPGHVLGRPSLGQGGSDGRGNRADGGTRAGTGVGSGLRTRGCGRHPDLHRERRAVRHGVDLHLDAPAGPFDVRGVRVVPDEVAAGAHRGHPRGARPHERVQDQVVDVGVEVDEPFRQGHGERGGVPDAGGRLRRELPHVQRGVHELVTGERGHRREPVPVPAPGGLRPVEPSLGRHDHALGEVPQDRVPGALEGTPGAVACGAALLLPDDLSPEQEPQPVLEDGDDVRRERPVGPPAEVGDVHGDPTAGLQRADALGEDLGEHLQVVQVGPGHVALPQRLLVLLAREVRGRGDHEGHGAVGHLAHGTGVPAEHVVQGPLRLTGRSRRLRGGHVRSGEAGVELR